MIASVHIADIGITASIPSLVRSLKVTDRSGLRHANVGLAAPLSGSLVPSPQPGRLALVAFWDDEEAIDAFDATHPLGARLAGGWQVRLEAVRRHGTWPGLPDELPTDRAIALDGPAVVLTLGRLRMTQAPRFFRTSAKAEAAVLEADGLIWASGLARPPFVATCSLWESSKALATYAYGHRRPAHHDAITADDDKPFHHRSAFIRFRPLRSTGGLDGRNPLRADWMTRAVPEAAPARPAAS